MEGVKRQELCRLIVWGFAKPWGTKVEIIVNMWCSQALEDYERSHSDGFGRLGLDMDPRARMGEVLGWRSISTIEESTQI